MHEAVGIHTRNQFEAELARVLGAAFGIAFNLTHSREEAEDLIQDTALQAFKAYESFEQGTNFKAWFFKILINKFRNDFRKKRTRPDIASLEDAPDLYMYAQASSAGLMTNSEDPGKRVLSAMTEEQIRNAIAALPGEFREVAALYFMEELQYQEIADIVECPVGTVRSRLHRGRKLLQKALWDIAWEHGRNP